MKHFGIAKQEVNDYYLFPTDDIKFDITKWDISLYLASADYYILSESNDEEVYIYFTIKIFKWKSGKSTRKIGHL